MSTPYTGSTAAGAPASPSTQEIQIQGNTAAYPQDQPYAAADHGVPVTEPVRPDVEGSSVGQLIGEVSKDLSTLMRQELELAKSELTTEAKKAGQGAGMFGAAGFAGYMVLLFLSLAAMWGLANVMDTGWAGLIVAAVWAVVGAVAFAMGRKKFQEVHPKPERTVDTLQQVPGALKPH